MKASIRGLGIWLPTELRLNDAWPTDFIAEARARGDRTLVDIPTAGADHAADVTARHLRETADDPFIGATQRYVAADEDHAWRAETDAARAALEDGGVSPEEVDAVLSWSIVPDRAAHATAPKVAAELGATGAFATSVDAGCASALVQLQLAVGLIESGRARHVVLTQSHLITRAFPLAHPAIATVLTGVRSAAEFEENERLFRHQIPDDMWQELKAEGLLAEEVPVPNNEEKSQ